MQAVSLKTSYLVAFKICLFQSFDIHLFFIAQPWYFYNKSPSWDGIFLPEIKYHMRDMEYGLH